MSPKGESSIEVPVTEKQTALPKLDGHFLNNISDKNNFSENLGFVPGEVIVKFRENRIDLEATDGLTKSRKFASRQNLTVQDSVKHSNLSVLKTRGEETV